MLYFKIAILIFLAGHQQFVKSKDSTFNLADRSMLGFSLRAIMWNHSSDQIGARKEMLEILDQIVMQINTVLSWKHNKHTNAVKEILNKAKLAILRWRPEPNATTTDFTKIALKLFDEYKSIVANISDEDKKHMAILYDSLDSQEISRIIQAKFIAEEYK